MAEFIAGGVVFAALLTVALLALLALAAIYIALRIRDSRSETPDPELGIKSAFYTFLSAGVLLALSGLTLSAVDFLNEALEEDKPNPQFQQPQFGPPGKFGPVVPPARAQPVDDPFDRVSQRIAWPLVISGVLFALVSLLLIVGGTNNASFPSVRRAFGGLRMVIGAFNVMTGVTFAIVLLFQKDLPTMQPFSLAIALIGVWFPAAAIELFLPKRTTKLPYYFPPKPKKEKRRIEEVDEEDHERDERRPRDRREREERREREDDGGSKERRRPLPRRRRDKEEGD